MLTRVGVPPPDLHDWNTWAWSIYVVGHFVTLVHRENLHRRDEALSPTRADDTEAGGTFFDRLNTTASIATPAMFWPVLAAWLLITRIRRIRRGRQLRRSGELFFHEDLTRLAKRLRRHPDAFRSLLGAVDDDLVHLVDGLIAVPAVEGWVTTRTANRRHAGMDRSTAPRDYPLGIALHLQFEHTIKVNDCDESERNQLRRRIGGRIPLYAQNCAAHLAALTAGLIHGWLDAERHDDARRFLTARLPLQADRIQRVLQRITRQQHNTCSSPHAAKPSAKAAHHVVTEGPGRAERHAHGQIGLEQP